MLNIFRKKTKNTVKVKKEPEKVYRRIKFNLKKVIKGIRFSLHLTFSMKEGWKYSVFKFFIVIFNNITPIVLTIFPGLIIKYNNKKFKYRVLPPFFHAKC